MEKQTLESAALSLAELCSNWAPRRECAQSCASRRASLYQLFACLHHVSAQLCGFYCPDHSTLMLPLKGGKWKSQKAVLQWEYSHLHERWNCSGYRKGEPCCDSRQAGREQGQTNSLLDAPYIDDEKISHSDAMGKKQTAPSAHRSGWGEPDQELSLWQAGLYAVHSGGDASWCFSVSCKQTMVWQDQELLLLPDRAFPHGSLSEQKAGRGEVTRKRALTEPCINPPLRLGNFLFALKCNNVNKLPVTLPGLFRTFEKTSSSSHREPRDASTTGTSHLGLRTLNESEGLYSLHKSGIVFQGWGCELRAIFWQYK